MRGRCIKLFVLTAAILLIAATVSAQPNPDKPYSQGVDEVKVVDQIPTISLPAVYIVRLVDPPLASYRGDMSGLQATNPGAASQTKLDVNSPASVAYRQYLAQKQEQVIAAMEQRFGHQIEVRYRYDVAYNGFAAWLTGEEAVELATLPGVAGVQKEFIRYPTTDSGPPWIGAPGIWDGSATGGPKTMGEGIIVGVIDTGINFDHPSFADVGGDGYDHANPFGGGVYKGWCDPANPNHDAGVHLCNDKLIGAWDYTGTPEKGEDDDGHGSHTSSTAAGNVLYNVPFEFGIVFSQISGVAPHANIIMYDTCIADQGCPGAGLIAAIDQAVADGVDVINYSIGGGANDPWNDADSQAFLNARDAGVFVATSAGNDGPGASTIGSPANAPWLLSIGAATHNRTFLNDLASMSGGGTTPPPDLHGTGVSSAYGPKPIVHAGAVPGGDPLCGTPFPTATWTNGEIVVCDRGQYALVDKAANVQAGGAGGVVIANQDFNGSQTYATNYGMPGTHLTYTDSELLRAWLASGSGHMATITASTKTTDPARGDLMALFSSRGPNPPVPGVIKPDVIAPGQDIFAAYRNGIEYASIGGTSMSSPHAAGAAALLRALYPAWTDAEIHSALMMTARRDLVRKEDETTPADPFDMGAGRVDLSKAAKAGLVLDETKADFDAANPATGGDPRQLNLASMADGDCQGTCSWTRTVKSTLATSADWTATVVGAPPGLDIIISPSNFTAAAGGTQALDVTADVTDFNAALDGRDGWGFAWLELSSPGLETLHLPIAVKKNYTSNPLLLSKEPSRLVAEPGDVVEYTIELLNRDSVTNTYSLVDSLPAGVEYVDGSATGGLVYNSGTHQMMWSGDVGPGAIDYVFTAVDPIPYVNLADLGASGICATYFPSDCDDVVLSWGISPESYTYYGETLDEVDQSSNSMIFGPEGWLGSACQACNQPLPHPDEINQVLAGLWRDTRPGKPPFAKGEFYGILLTGLLANPGDAVFYGNWHDVGQYGALSITSRHAIAIVLDGQSEPAGRIYYIYDDITGDLTTNGYTVGVENKYGDRGTTWAYAPCHGGSCIPSPPPPVGSPPANGTTLRADPVISGENYRRVFTYKARVTSDQAGVLTNKVEVTSNSPDPDAQGMWASADVSIPPFFLHKEVFPRTQDPGGVVTYTIAFGNRSGENLTGAVVSDTLPADVQYASSDPLGNYNPATHELVWPGLNLNAGDSVMATVVVTTNPGVTPGIWLHNRVYFFFDDIDPLVAEASHFTVALDRAVYLPLIFRNH